MAMFIAMAGPRAGVGKSFFAINFARALSQETLGKILLLDIDAQDCGDIHVLLGLKPAHTLLELSKGASRILQSDFASLIKPFYKNIFCMQATPKPNQLEQISLENLQTLLQLIDHEYEYVVMDVGSDLNEHTRFLHDQSSLILFLTTPEITPLQKSQFLLQEFLNAGFQSDHVQLIINRYNDEGSINEAIIKQKLKKNIFAFLPDDPNVSVCIEKAKTMLELHPKSGYSVVVEKLTGHLISSKSQLKQNLKSPLKKNQIHIQPSQGAPHEDVHVEQKDEIKQKVHQKLLEVMDLKRLSVEEFLKHDDAKFLDLKSKTQDAIFSILESMPEVKSRDERKLIAKEVLNEALGLGPLEDLLSDGAITEILVNGFDNIYIEKQGRLQKAQAKFTSNKQLLGVIERIVAPIGRRIDEKTPMVDARLKDGSRVHAIIPPLSLDGPMLTIRKFSKSILGPDHLINLGALSPHMASFLKSCVEARLNILVSGGTGAGKTTLLNVISSFIPAHERIITVEDSAELQLPQEHVGRLESRPSNLQGEGSIPIRELVRNTLRMRPDRIIVGECRGAEALDMLQAMNTGHDGSMTTIHSNSPKDCMSRLETLVMFAGMELPSRAIREQIGSAIDLVVQLSRLSDGSRKITRITEVLGVSEKDASNIELQDLFYFNQKGVDATGKVLGTFVSSNLRPKCFDVFEQKGIALPQGFVTMTKKTS